MKLKANKWLKHCRWGVKTHDDPLLLANDSCHHFFCGSVAALLGLSGLVRICKKKLSDIGGVCWSSSRFAGGRGLIRGPAWGPGIRRPPRRGGGHGWPGSGPNDTCGGQGTVAGGDPVPSMHSQRPRGEGVGVRGWLGGGGLGLPSRG